MGFLDEQPSWSKSSVHKMIRSLREGKTYDKALFNDFMMQHALLVQALEPIIDDTFGSFTLIEAGDGEEIAPNSGRYRLSSRTKIFRTTVEKIRRMRTTPIYRIQDIAGCRVDFDGTHTIQDSMATRLEEAMERSGADKVKILDLRSNPHSGYRAVHLHVDFPAGKIEIQLRTALQAQWANLYEVAADIFGRQIRYDDWSAGLDQGEQTIVTALHGISDGIYDFERFRQSVQGRHREENKQGNLATPVQEINDQAEQLYGRIDDMLNVFREIRDRMRSTPAENKSREAR